MEVRKNMAGIQEITNLFSSIALHVIKLIENYSKPTKVGLLMAQILQKLRFGSSLHVRKLEQSDCSRGKANM